MTQETKPLGSAIELALRLESPAQCEYEAARAELRALMDAALVLRRVINEDGGERSLWFTDGVARRHGWILKSFPLGVVPNETISTGPIVNGLPVLDAAARRALGEGT